jgi:hypothetical protein
MRLEGPEVKIGMVLRVYAAASAGRQTFRKVLQISSKKFGSAQSAIVSDKPYQNG